MITAQIESFERAIPELAPLFDQHWQELGLFRDQMPLAPQYDEYVARERGGSLVLATVRRNGVIAAYYTAQVALALHYGTTLTAHMDLMYVAPQHKGCGLSFPLVRCMERELKRRGVQVWYSGWKTRREQGMEHLHKLWGFQPADTMAVKWLGD